MDHNLNRYQLLEQLWNPANGLHYPQIMQILFDHHRFTVSRNALLHLVRAHPDEQIRASALHLLGFTRDDTLLPLLVAYLDDVNQTDQLRRHAVHGLIALQTASAEATIRHRLTTADVSVRIAIMDALTTNDHHFGAAIFLDALTDPDEEVQRLALDGLTSYGDVVPLNAILPFVDHPEVSLRQAALALLQLMTVTRDALPILVEHLLHDSDELVRERAGQLLGDHLDVWGNDTPFHALTQALNDPYFPVREVALLAFQRVPAALPAKDVIERLHDSNDVVQMAAIQALQATRDPQFIPNLQALMDTLRSDSNGEVDAYDGFPTIDDLRHHKVKRFAIRAIMILQGFDIPDEPLFGVIIIS